MSAATAGELVWVKGMRGPTPERWNADTLLAHRAVVLARHPLTEAEFAMPLAALERLFPAPPEDQWPAEARS